MEKLSLKNKDSAYKLKSLLDQLYKPCLKPAGDMQNTEQIGLVYLILSTLINDFSQLNGSLPNLENDPKSLNYIEKALKWINRNYTQQIDIPTLAQIANISPSYFAHLFKKHLHQTPMEYIESLRAIHAEQLLKNSDLSVEMISAKVGFSNTKSLTNTFKVLFKDTPHQYRLKSKKSSI